MLLIGAIIFFLFRSWFHHGVISGSDFTYIYPTQFKEFTLQPYAWSGIFGNGLGGVTLNILNLDFYLHGLGGALVNLIDMSWDAAYRVLFFWPFLIIGFFGAYELGRSVIKHKGYSAISSLVYLVNTYILMIVGGGQVGLMMAYAVAPYVLASYINRQQRIFLAASTLLVLFDLRFSVLVFGAVIFYTLIIIPYTRWLDSLRFVFPCAVVVIGLHSFWLIPSVWSRTLVVPEGYDDPGWLSFLSWADFPKTVSLLHPNWPQNIFGKVSFMKPEFLLLPLMVFFPLVGGGKENRQMRSSYYFFLLLLLMGAFLAKGVNPPMGNLYEWLFVHAPLFSGFRDPTKFYLLSSLAYAVLIPYAVMWAVNHPVLRRLKRSEDSFMAITVLLWLIIMAPFVTGKLGGTFKKITIPNEYRQFEQIASGSTEFQRTLVVPWRNRFVYNTTSTPAMDASALFKTRDYSEIRDRLGSPELSEILARYAIRYVIVPEDTTEEIFLTDRTYDAHLRETIVAKLDMLPFLSKRNDFRSMTVYEVRRNYGHFFVEQADGNILPLSSTQQNPTRYDLRLPESQAETRLVFSEQFNPRWRLYDGSKNIESIKTYDGLNSFLITSGSARTAEISFSLQEEIYRWQKFSLFVLFLCCTAFCIDVIRKRGIGGRQIGMTVGGIFLLGLSMTILSIASRGSIRWSNEWVKVKNPLDGKLFSQTSYEGSVLQFKVIGASSVALEVSGMDKKQAVGMEVTVNGQPYPVTDIGERAVDRILIHGPVTGFEARVRAVCSGAPDCLVTVRDIRVPLSGIFLPIASKTTRTLAILGDSISGMHGINGYGYRVADKLRLGFHNASIIGSTLTEGGGYMPGVRRYERDIVGYKPDIIIIALGANDVLQRVSPQEFSDAYARIVERIRSILPQSTLIIFGVFPQSHATDQMVRTYNRHIKEIADTHGIIYVDTYSLISKELFQDALHPDVTAQERIAEAVILSLTKEGSHE